MIFVVTTMHFTKKGSANLWEIFFSNLAKKRFALF